MIRLLLLINVEVTCHYFKEEVKMIAITVAMEQDKVIDLLNSLEENGTTFSFKEKKGIKLIFETNTTDLDSAAKIAKSAIKGQSWGSILFFQVAPV